MIQVEQAPTRRKERIMGWVLFTVHDRNASMLYNEEYERNVRC